jgi:hypothetical protein
MWVYNVTMVYGGLRWSTEVYGGLQWSTEVYDGLQRSTMVYATFCCLNSWTHLITPIVLFNYTWGRVSENKSCGRKEGNLVT